MSIWTILLIIFIVLKLAGLVSWSWWFVLSPLWLPLVIGALAAISDDLNSWLEQ